MRSVWLCALLVGFCPSLFASSTRLVSVSALARNADLVVLGHVLTGESFWQDGRILTRTRIRVDEVWTGSISAGAEIEVLALGGVVGDLAQRVDGMPAFASGERLALLLARDAHRGYYPLGLWQGVFRVRDETTNAPIHRDTGAARVVSGVFAATVPLTLSALRNAVSEAQRE